MKPPIFSITQTGSIAQQNIRTAPKCSERLRCNYRTTLTVSSSGQKYALPTYAIELLLKAFAHISCREWKGAG